MFNPRMFHLYFEEKKIEYEVWYKSQEQSLTMAPVLTRYLYHRDEVSHSLLTCLLLKSTFKEALFWASEMYYSGYHKEIWELLWKIYYDFFAIRNPKFEKKIRRAYKKWSDTDDATHLIGVINL